MTALDALPSVPPRAARLAAHALLLFASFVLVFVLVPLAGATPPAENASLTGASATLTLLDRYDAPTVAITDGDRVRLRAELARPAERALELRFRLDDGAAVARCRVPAGGSSCTSEPFAALGWAWTRSGVRRAARTLRLLAAEDAQLARLGVAVAPRPVLLVHGFASSPGTWDAWLGAGGFLAELDLPGAAAELELGDPSRPLRRTANLEENAAALGRQIAALRAETGAEMVDLVAHSMGGLVARAYLAWTMGERDVAQLVMIGTPHGGSSCAQLPAALGFHLPAALELRPAWVRDVLAPQLGDRRGVPFTTLAGTPIRHPVGAPCTGTPSDLVVARASAGSIGPVAELPVLHTEQTGSREAFERFAAPLLRRPAGAFEPRPDEAIPHPDARTGAPPEQLAALLTGRLEPGAARDLVVHLDAVAVATFALHDPTLSLEVEVRGAGGDPVRLTPDANGLVEIDDPAALTQLGYGFENPRPGPWRVTLRAAESAPADGAPFAISAAVVGGAALRAAVRPLLPRRGEPVAISARLDAAERLEPLGAEAVVTAPDGSVRRIPLERSGDAWRAAWHPERRGPHAVDVTVRGRRADGLIVTRTAPLAAEVRRR